MVVAESEHCAADGIQALTGAATGNRDLIVKDRGKLAYTFYRKSDGKAVRMAWVAGLHPAYQDLRNKVQSDGPHDGTLSAHSIRKGTFGGVAPGLPGACWGRARFENPRNNCR